MTTYLTISAIAGGSAIIGAFVGLRGPICVIAMAVIAAVAVVLA